MTYTSVIVKNVQKVILSVLLIFGMVGLVLFYRLRSATVQLTTLPSQNIQEVALGEEWQEAGFYRFLDTQTHFEYEVMGTVAGYDVLTNDAGMKENILMLDISDGKQLPISLGNDEYYQHVYDEVKADEGINEGFEQIVSASYPASEIVTKIPVGRNVLVRYAVKREDNRTLTYYKGYLDALRRDENVEPVVFDFAMVKMIVVQL